MRCLFLFLAFGWGLFAFGEVSHQPSGNTSVPPAGLRAPLPKGMECSALAEFLFLNGGNIPTNEAEWQEAFARMGEFHRVDVVFSDSLSQTSLEDARYLFTQGDFSDDSGRQTAAPTQPNLVNRLYISVGTNEQGKKIAEFFAFNPLLQAYETGVIDPSANPVVRREPMVKCAECHKTEGPTMSAYPWSHTTANPVNFVARVKRLFDLDPEQYGELHQEVERLRKKGTLTDEARDNEIIGRARVDGIPLYQRTFDYYGSQEKQYPFRSGSADLKDRSDAHLFHFNVAHAGKILYAHQIMRSSNDPEKLKRVIQSAVLDPIVSDVIQHYDLYDQEERLSPYNLRGDDSNLPTKQHTAVFKDVDHIFGEFPHGPASVLNVGVLKSRMLNDSAIEKTLAYDQKRRELIEAGKRVPPGPADPRAPETHDTQFQSHYLPFDDFNAMGVTQKDLEFLGETFREAATALAKKSGKTLDEIKREAGAALLKDPAVQRLFGLQRFPQRAEYKRAIMAAMDSYFKGHGVNQVGEIPESKYIAIAGFPYCDGKRIEMPSVTSPRAGLTQKCSRCHTPNSEVLQYVGDLNEWERKINQGDEEAKTWLEKFYKEIVLNKRMPPQKSPEAGSFAGSAEEERLKSFLKRNRDKIRSSSGAGGRR